MSRGATSPAESQIEVAGLTIGFEHAGSGPPLVLLHGGLSDHREWSRQLADLSDEFMVVAWDAPGCGRSTDPPDWYRMPDYADRLATLIETLDLEHPHVLGLSWGSALALELYRRRPDIPRTLTLTAAYSGWAGSLSPQVVTERLDTALRDLDSMSSSDYARSWVPSLFTERASNRVVEEYVAIMAQFHPGGVRQMLRAIAEADLREMLPDITVPTLLLYGEKDQRSPVSVAEEMHRAIPSSTLVVLPGVGHMANLEDPDAFNGAIRSFLADR